MIIHELKIQDEYLNNLKFGYKKAEIRLNDRDYQVGDILKFINNGDVSVGDEDFYLYFKVIHIHSGLGLERNYIAMSVEQISSDKVVD